MTFVSLFIYCYRFVILDLILVESLIHTILSLLVSVFNNGLLLVYCTTVIVATLFLMMTVSFYWFIVIHFIKLMWTTYIIFHLNFQKDIAIGDNPTVKLDEPSIPMKCRENNYLDADELSKAYRIRVDGLKSCRHGLSQCSTCLQSTKKCTLNQQCCVWWDNEVYRIYIHWIKHES